MIRTLIVDDEEHGIRLLRAMLQRYMPDALVVAEARTAAEAREVVRIHTPDLVFLDIHLPGDTALRPPDSLHPTPCSFLTVFVTAYDPYPLHTAREGAPDVLVKPLDPDEFCATARRIRTTIQHVRHQRLLHQRHNTPLSASIPDHLLPAARRRRLYLPMARGVYEAVDLTAVTHCRAQRNYCAFVLAPDREILVTRPLKQYTSVLSTHGFLRPHLSYMVNPAFVRAYRPEGGKSNSGKSNGGKRTGGTLVLRDGTELPVSRRLKEELLHRLGGNGPVYGKGVQ